MFLVVNFRFLIWYLDIGLYIYGQVMVGGGSLNHPAAMNVLSGYARISHNVTKQILLSILFDKITLDTGNFLSIQ